LYFYLKNGNNYDVIIVTIIFEFVLSVYITYIYISKHYQKYKRLFYYYVWVTILLLLKISFLFALILM